MMACAWCGLVTRRVDPVDDLPRHGWCSSPQVWPWAGRVHKPPPAWKREQLEVAKRARAAQGAMVPDRQPEYRNTVDVKSELL